MTRSIICVDGNPGAHGRRGLDGGDGLLRGSGGESGAPAGPASPGVSGGAITATIEATEDAPGSYSCAYVCIAPGTGLHEDSQEFAGDSRYEAHAGIDFTRSFDTVAIEVTRWPWGLPLSDALHSKALALQVKLCHRYPHRRYLVIHHGGNPEFIGRRFGILKRWALGHFELRRSLNLLRTAAARIHWHGAQLSSRSCSNSSPTSAVDRRRRATGRAI